MLVAAIMSRVASELIKLKLLGMALNQPSLLILLRLHYRSRRTTARAYKERNKGKAVGHLAVRLDDKTGYERPTYRLGPV